MSTKRKIMLIGAIIGAVLPIIFVIIILIFQTPQSHHNTNTPAEVFAGVLAGIWFCIGIGGNIDLIADIPGIFFIALKEEGLVEAIKGTVVGSLVWAVIFTLLGPIGFLVRFYRNA